MNTFASPALRAPRDTARASRPAVASDPVARAAFASFVVRARVARANDADDLAAQLWPSDPQTRAILKASATPASAGGHAALVQAATTDFLMALPMSAGAGLMAEAAMIPMDRNASVIAPLDVSNPAAPAPWVVENDPIAVSSGTTAAVTLGPSRKLGVILALSRSLAKQAGAEALFRLMLYRRAAAALDAALFATAAGDSARVAGLLNGVTPLNAGPVASLTEALEAVAGALGDASGSGRVVIAADPRTATAIQLRHPLLSWPVLASRQIPAGRIVGIDPAGLLFGAGVEIEIDVTNAATLHMSDEPLEITSDVPVTADPVRELWQTDALAVRLLLDVAFAARVGAVQYLDTWGV